MKTELIESLDFTEEDYNEKIGIRRKEKQSST